MALATFLLILIFVGIVVGVLVGSFAGLARFHRRDCRFRIIVLSEKLKKPVDAFIKLR